MHTRWQRFVPIGAVLLLGALGATPSANRTMSEEALAPLWVEPKDLESRDLLHGPGGKDGAPQADAVYRFAKLDDTGHSRGYHVVGPDGRKWKVKVGDEAQSEIAVSRILWAIGYHQPSLYYLAEWKIAGGPDAHPGPGRFRLDSDHDAEGEWAFDDNPFVGTRELTGLVLANILLNNWDLAPSNNRIYRVGKGAARLTWYVAQDVGGSLGKSKLPLGTRNRIDDFETQRFVLGVEKGRVSFDYHGLHKELLKHVTPQEVAWVSRLLARLSDAQLQDAFRAAGYTDDVRARYVRKIEAKIGEGVAVKETP